MVNVHRRTNNGTEPRKVLARSGNRNKVIGSTEYQTVIDKNLANLSPENAVAVPDDNSLVLGKDVRPELEKTFSHHLANLPVQYDGSVGRVFDPAKW